VSAIVKFVQIYVPIEDTNGHWYLMVVSMDTQKIYHLDSHFKEEALEERRFTIRNIVRLRVYILSLITKPFIFSIILDTNITTFMI
jgi:Ulp1 family protease